MDPEAANWAPGFEIQCPRCGRAVPLEQGAGPCPHCGQDLAGAETGRYTPGDVPARRVFSWILLVVMALGIVAGLAAVVWGQNMPGPP